MKLINQLIQHDNMKCPFCEKPATIFYMGLKVCGEHHSHEFCQKHSHRWGNLLKPQL